MSTSLWVHIGPCLEVPAGTKVENIVGDDRFCVVGREAPRMPHLYLYSNFDGAPGRAYERNSASRTPLVVTSSMMTDECDAFSGFYEREMRALVAALGADRVSLAWRIVSEWW